jgi:formylglycine-generating enzyme required for sulfatase activity
MGSSKWNTFINVIQGNLWVLFLTKNEKPFHNVHLSAYKIARYPVTVGEYRLFMDSGGYENDSYWKVEGALRWRNAPLPFEESYQYKQFLAAQGNPLLKQLVQSAAKTDAKRKLGDSAWFESVTAEDTDHARKLWEDRENEKRDIAGKAVKPYLWETQKYSVENQPVIGITWYEACAYAAWLTETLQLKGLIAENKHIRLPTEAEWEKASRGNTDRVWAWGSLWSNSYANTFNARINQPSSVGAYPKNVSPYGVEEMTGNVWEWCLDVYNGNEYMQRFGKEVKDPCKKDGGDARVLRGGSWLVNRNVARCSSRLLNAPDNFYNLIGFRLVCSPSSPLHSESLSSESLTRDDES